VAFTIRLPFGGRRSPIDGWRFRPALVTIWHRDPEKGEGGDDSCDWAGRRRPLNARERALWLALDDLFHRLGNPPFYPDPRLYGDYVEGEQGRVRTGLVPEAQRAVWAWQRRVRFRWHPRWHVH